MARTGSQWVANTLIDRHPAAFTHHTYPFNSRGGRVLRARRAVLRPAQSRRTGKGWSEAQVMHNPSLCNCMVPTQGHTAAHAVPGQQQWYQAPPRPALPLTMWASTAATSASIAACTSNKEDAVVSSGLQGAALWNSWRSRHWEGGTTQGNNKPPTAGAISHAAAYDVGLYCGEVGEYCGLVGLYCGLHNRGSRTGWMAQRRCPLRQLSAAPAHIIRRNATPHPFNSRGGRVLRRRGAVLRPAARFGRGQQQQEVSRCEGTVTVARRTCQEKAAR